MEHGFSPASHHGPCGGISAIILGNDAPSEEAANGATATASGATFNDHEPNYEPEHVNDKNIKQKNCEIEKQQTDIIFNLSSITLTEPMKRLLNRALNFAILPLKLDITEVLVDFNIYSMAVVWHEYWHGKEDDGENDISKPIFNIKKNNLPKNYSSPSGLKTFLNSIKSEIMDPRNRNEEECNLPEEEVIALKQLFKLQRERTITIRPCDKGAGIVILDFNVYMRACYEHLLSKQPSQTILADEEKSYYKKKDKFALERAKKHIESVLKEGLENEIITTEEYNAMDPADKNPSKFYCNMKIHKAHDNIPPVRPIISGSGSIKQNIGVYVEHHINTLSTSRPIPPTYKTLHIS